MKAFKLLNSPEKWCKQAMARNIEGSEISPFNKKACQWSIYGAIMKCYGRKPGLFVENYIKIAGKLDKKYKGSIELFNDETTYEEVVELLKENCV